MARAKQAQSRGIVELAQAVEAHGVQALQRQALAAVEVSEMSIGSMSLARRVPR